MVGVGVAVGVAVGVGVVKKFKPSPWTKSEIASTTLPKVAEAHNRFRAGLAWLGIESEPTQAVVKQDRSHNRYEPQSNNN